ncbi:MAG: preprotein translocase subunit SecE [Gemmatimonadota bacterium]|uniref:Preprotein translocase subunit SecE n=1 Tax=marine metagenome TaxID=408172 RepID=A0A381XMW7_9ZZZZ|nr:preprotein translocase subunit SecE [Gemmatimonadota bacterium]
MAIGGKIVATRDFVEECWEEMAKVTWPDYDQLKSATLVVIVFVILISAIIWIMDMASRTVINLIMGIFGA